MLSGFIGLLLLIAPADAPSADRPSPEQIKAFLERCETGRRGTILQLEHTLRGLRSQSSTSLATARRIKQVEEDLRRLRANTEPLVPTLTFPPKIGAIGRLPRLTCHVDQILGDNEMLVRSFFRLQVPVVKRYQPHAETVVQPLTFLVRGLPTAPFHEGTDIELSQAFCVAGQKSYRSESGTTQTAYVLTPFEMKWIEPYFTPGSGFRAAR